MRILIPSLVILNPMEENSVKIVKRTMKVVICIPLVLIILVIAFEIIGMIVNHIATGMQTRELKNMIKTELTSAEIIDTYSETGNTSGTGNHVDMLSEILFSTDDSLDEIESKLQDNLEFDEWSCWIEEVDIPGQTGQCYLLYVNESAPFADNIEGH